MALSEIVPSTNTNAIMMKLLKEGSFLKITYKEHDDEENITLCDC